MSGEGSGEAVAIAITMASTQPPQGEVTVVGGSGQPFVGWLQLLRILVEETAKYPTGVGYQTSPFPSESESITEERGT